MTEPLNGRPRPVDPSPRVPTVRYSQKGCLDWSWPLALAVSIVALAISVTSVMNARMSEYVDKAIIAACEHRPVREIDDCIVAFRRGLKD